MSAPAPTRPGRGCRASSASRRIPDEHVAAVVEFHLGRANGPVTATGQRAARTAVDALMCQRCGQSRIPPAMCQCAGAGP